MTDEEKTGNLNNALEAMEAISPIFDMADGMRADLERRGWSPTMAEAVAGEWLRAAMSKIWTQA